MFQLYIHLAQLGCQQAGEIGHGQVREQVDENNRLQCSKFRMSSGVGRHYSEISQLQNSSIKNEG